MHKSNKSKKILISPLNWGLGHAVRDIPLINKLISAGYEVIIATEGASAELLKKEFPKLLHIELKSFSIKYPKKNAFVFKMLIQLPKIIRGIRKEHKQVQKIIKQQNIDLIISDNRYGVYSKEVPSIFITHQIFIQLPKQIKFLEGIVFKMQQNKISKFSKCLIPDYKNEINLSGKLSHKQRLPAEFSFVGILSQFQYNKEDSKEYINDILIILSGPEPQRTILETKIIKQLEGTNKKVLLVSGQPEKSFSKNNSNIKYVNHLSRKEMQFAIQNSEIIISRAGYTTIMDLVKLQKKAILIPTPSQTEQEYLANYLKNKNMFIFCKQDNFIIDEVIKKIQKLQTNFSVFEKAKKDNFLNVVKNTFHPDFLDNEKCVTKR
ncbi:MAG: UDP-N-acetylglucosamine--N-acetylmuramyl-(pentapeptide) pyrophosphoryl-undecaprenol N-acetylglucosamine transferase [Chlorobi bacterium]|nr:UDP-N-acetylglucosamine--N-acetylmuramyl-(pentapeptide) pyrophosphoryl-undecaprenol N-acetylglucosamine transferase [Chlorobiota bacterium]